METTDIIGVVLGEISLKYKDIATSEWSVSLGQTVQELLVDKLGVPTWDPCVPMFQCNLLAFVQKATISNSFTTDNLIF